MRVFAIYSDFVVREMGDAKGITVGEIGRFTIGPSFQLVKKNQNEKSVDHHLMKIMIYGGEMLPDGAKKYGPILLTRTFELTDISEKPAQKEKLEKTGFFTEFAFQIRDSSGTIKVFTYDHYFPGNISYKDFQRFLFDIKNNLAGFQSFREIELTKEIQSKDDELNKLKDQLKETDMKD
jgi:hypothetical protein